MTPRQQPTPYTSVIVGRVWAFILSLAYLLLPGNLRQGIVKRDIESRRVFSSSGVSKMVRSNKADAESNFVDQLDAAQKRRLFSLLKGDNVCADLAQTETPPYYDPSHNQPADTVVIHESPKTRAGVEYAAWELSRILPNGMAFKLAITKGGVLSVKPDFRFGSNRRPVIGFSGSPERVVDTLTFLSSRDIRNDAHTRTLGYARIPCYFVPPRPPLSSIYIYIIPLLDFFQI
jgi:hypothetical protein